MYLFCVNIKVFDDFAFDHLRITDNGFQLGSLVHFTFCVHHVAVITIVHKQLRTPGGKNTRTL